MAVTDLFSQEVLWDIRWSIRIESYLLSVEN